MVDMPQISLYHVSRNVVCNSCSPITWYMVEWAICVHVICLPQTNGRWVFCGWLLIHGESKHSISVANSTAMAGDMPLATLTPCHHPISWHEKNKFKNHCQWNSVTPCPGKTQKLHPASPRAASHPGFPWIWHNVIILTGFLMSPPLQIPTGC